MIKVRLICGRDGGELRAALESRGISIAEEAGVSIVERGQSPPPEGVCILFDPASPDTLLALLSDLSRTQAPKQINLITAKKDGGFHPLKLERIRYFESDGNAVYCHAEGARYEVQEKLYELETRLQSKAFLRIHKSFIVNAAWIEDILPWFGGRLLLRLKGGAAELEVSRNYVADFKVFLGM
jgi:DNA-binding LytR/AlgR family response regulator